MNKKQKEELKRLFIEKHKELKVIIRENGCMDTEIDDYMEQEQYRRK